jgi:transposase
MKGTGNAAHHLRQSWALSGEAIRLQSRVIAALVRRETRAHFGEMRLGYLWAIIEPALHLIVLGLLFSYVLRRHSPLGGSMIMFMLTGLMTYFLFYKLATYVAGAVSENRALLNLPPLLKGSLATRDKASVTCAQRLVDQIHIKFKGYAHTETKPRAHAAGIGFYRLVKVLAEISKPFDEIDNLGDVKTVDARKKGGIVPPRHVSGEATGVAQRKRDAGAAPNATTFGQFGATDQAQQRGFSRPVQAENSDVLTRVEHKVNGIEDHLTADTILGWYRKLVARKFDGSKVRRSPGRPRIKREVEQLIIRLASENRDWGYDRIVGALTNLGFEISDQTVGNVLRRHGLPPAPERKRTTSWGKGNVLLYPRDTDRHREGPVRCRERLGGLLRYYHQEAA